MLSHCEVSLQFALDTSWNIEYVHTFPYTNSWHVVWGFWHVECFSPSCVLTRAMASQWTDSSTCCSRFETSTMRRCWRSGLWCSGNTLGLCIWTLRHGKSHFWTIHGVSPFVSVREIFELDNYSPIPVETEVEYKLVVSRFPFHDAEIEKVCSAFSDRQGVWLMTQWWLCTLDYKDYVFAKFLNAISASCLVLYHAATISKEAAHVPFSASDLHSGQGVHLCQLKVLRVTTSQVSALNVQSHRSSRSHPSVCVGLS